MDGTCTETIFVVSATIPVGGTATVAVPVRGHLADAIVTEGDVVVWKAGAFVPGVAGVKSAVSTPTAIVFSVGSGAYEFTLAK